MRAALARLKSDRQRDIITRIYFDGQERKNIAADLGITVGGLSTQEHAGYRKLRHDYQLRKYALEMPFVHVGMGYFNSHFTSSVELAAMLREQRFNERFGDGAFLAAGRHDPGEVQTSTGEGA